MEDARFNRPHFHPHDLRDFRVRQVFFTVEDQRLPLQFGQVFHRFLNFQVEEYPVRVVFGHHTLPVCQVEGDPHLHRLVIEREFFEAPLPPQNIITTVAGDAEYIWAQILHRVNRVQVEIEGDKRVLHNVFCFLAAPAGEPVDKPGDGRFQGRMKLLESHIIAALRLAQKFVFLNRIGHKRVPPTCLVLRSSRETGSKLGGI